MTTTTRSGVCVCGVPVAEHFNRDNQDIGCDAARRRMQQRAVGELSQLELMLTTLAVVLLTRADRPISALGPFATLTEDEQKELRYLAVGAITATDRTKRRVARARAVARGTEEFRKNTGWAELPLRLQDQMRRIITTSLNAYDNALQGLEPITEFEIDRELGLEQLLPDAPVRRAVESAPSCEFVFRHVHGDCRAFTATSEDEARTMLERSLAADVFDDDIENWRLQPAPRVVESAQASEGRVQ